MWGIGDEQDAHPALALAQVACCDGYLQLRTLTGTDGSVAYPDAESSVEDLHLLDVQVALAGIGEDDVVADGFLTALDVKLDRRLADGELGCSGKFVVAHAGKARQQDGGDEYLIRVPNLVAHVAGKVDAGLVKPEGGELLAVERETDDAGLARRNVLGFTLDGEVWRQMHQFGTEGSAVRVQQVQLRRWPVSAADILKLHGVRHQPHVASPSEYKASC